MKKIKDLLVILLLIGILFISAYLFSIQPGLTNSNDLSLENLELAKTYYLSSVYIFQNSFSYFGYLSIILIPFLCLDYSNNYFHKSDIYYCYRKGVNNYAIKNYLKVIFRLFIVLIIVMGLYYLFVEAFSISDLYLFEGSNDSLSFVPTIVIKNVSMKNILMNNTNTNIYIFICLFMMILRLVSFGMFCFSISSFIKNRFARYIVPVLVVVICDFLFSSIIFDLPDSLFFSIFNTYFFFEPIVLNLPTVFLFFIAIILFIIHLKERRNNG